MTNEIQVVNNEKSALVPMQFNEQQVDLIKKTVANGTTNDELSLFLYTCKKTGLDPLIKQIYAVKRNTKNGPVMSIQTGIDGYRLIAERSGKYAPGKEPSFKYDKDGKLFSATAYVNKFVGGSWHEVAATAIYSEYANNTNPIWIKMPHTMISKCAESLVLRKAFPAEMGGVYTKEEMEQADAIIVEPKHTNAVVNKAIEHKPQETIVNAVEVPPTPSKSKPNVDEEGFMSIDDAIPQGDITEGIELKEGQRVVEGILTKYYPPSVSPTTGKTGPFQVYVNKLKFSSFNHDFRDLLSKLEGKVIKLVYSTKEYNGKEQYTIEELI